MKYIALIISLFIFSCKDPVSVEDNKKITDNQTIDLSFETILQSSHIIQSNKKENIVIRSKEQENLHTSEWNVDLPWENINYDEEMVIGITFYAQPTGAAFVNIDKIKLSAEGEIIVHSTFTLPEIGTADIGYPVHFVKLKKYENKVLFAETIIIDHTNQNIELAQTKWVLHKFYDINNNEYLVEDLNGVKADQRFALNFIESNSFEGEASCNSIGGNYIQSQREIKFEDVWGTEAACPWSWEFQEALINSKNYSSSETSLTLFSSSEDMAVLVFVPDITLEEPKPELYNTKWKLKYWVDANNNQRTDVNGSWDFGPKVNLLDYILEFDELTYTAISNTSINFGAFVTNDFGIDFDHESTKGNDTEFSEEFRRGLANAVSWNADPAHLFIEINDTEIKQFVFEVYKDEENHDQINGNWNLKSVLSDGYLFELRSENDEEQVFSINFSNHSNITGVAECNDYESLYKIGAFSLFFDPIASTKVECDNSFEFMDALNKVTRYSITHDELVLFSSSENFQQLRFTK